MANKIDKLFSLMRDQDGSDLHLAAGIQPRIRLRGEVVTLEDWPVLTSSDVRELLRETTSDKQWKDYEEKNDLDFAYEIPGVSRYRANCFVQQNGAAAVFRLIPETVRPLEELGLPDTLKKFGQLSKGLVLVTGPTGSGKSTTLAAMINEINQEFKKHIVTVEDPIEFVHQDKESTFSQREVGTHTASFSRALKSAIHQDANVILVGEMRDLETISLALTAAEMGVLVFGTLHTNSAPKAIDRILDVYPPEQTSQVRSILAESLAGIVSQLLLRTADGKDRAPAVEILLRSSALPPVIREGNTRMITSVMQGGYAQGMRTMDQALMQLVKSGRINGEQAYRKATEKKQFEQFAGET